MTKTKRDSKIELLRIICMILIIMHHFSYHSGFVLDGSVPVLNKVTIDGFLIGGKIGVNIFILISGYFLVDKEFKVSRLVKLALEIFFYSSIIYLLFLITGQIEFSFEALVHNFFPILTLRYWFITPYVLIYLLSPLINKLIKNLNQKKYSLFLLIIVLVQVGITFCLNLNKTAFGTIVTPTEVSVLQSVLDYFVKILSSSCWFFTLYLIAGYIKKYPPKICNSFSKNLVIFLVSYATLIFVQIFFNYPLYEMSTATCLIASVSLFNTFNSIKKPISSRFINIISQTTLAIYLIHDNKFVRSFIWEKLFNCANLINNKLLPLIAIGIVLAIFIVCCLIDLFRIYCVEKPIFKLFNILNQKRTKHSNAIIDKENGINT